MSEEEIKAIDRLKYALIYDRESISSLMGFNDIKIVLQLVNKQEKEIEEFRGIKNGTTIIYKCKAKYVREDKINKYYVEKNKIREKIKELEKEMEEKREHGLDLTLIHEHEIDTNAIIQVLSELLEE